MGMMRNCKVNVLYNAELYAEKLFLLDRSPRSPFDDTRLAIIEAELSLRGMMGEWAEYERTYSGVDIYTNYTGLAWVVLGRNDIMQGVQCYLNVGSVVQQIRDGGLKWLSA